MNVIGHGIDVADVRRLTRILEAKFSLVASYYFAHQEILDFELKSPGYRTMCGKVAVKEAVLKSLGLGLGRGVSFNQIVVTRRKGTAIEISIAGPIEDHARTLGVDGFLASLSYCDGKAYASVLAVRV